MTRAFGAIALTAGALSVATATAGAQPASVVPAPEGTAVPGQYVVVLKDDAAVSASADLTARHGGKVTATWNRAINGFAVQASEDEAKRLAADPAVKTVVQNGRVQKTDIQTNPPSWGLDRIDQRNLPLNSGYSYTTQASNVTVYVIDTGIRTTHSTFGGRASWGADFIDGTKVDCNGHGTHVAGTAAGAEYGVAKGAKVVAVRVLDCQGGGTFASVLSGIEWVTANAVKPAVANMSLGAVAGTQTEPIEQAVRASIASGVTYAVASGNANTDACQFSPARVAEALTVNASTVTDQRAVFSNYGRCTDLFAPGEAIKSAWIGGDNATETIDGTSMASPHVAGAAALYLGANPNATPAEVGTALLGQTTPDKIGNPGAESPNKLLFNGGGTPGATVVLTRYQKAPDHVSTVNGAPGEGFVTEGKLGKLFYGQEPNTHAVYQCRSDWDYFTSANAACEGKTVIATLGYAFNSAQANSRPLYRCQVKGTGDHMDSASSTCEGQTTEGILGHVVK
ncbi:hypothetical protein GCM10022243_54580 [Saccharothrix violaceirubra]|uniref:Subtilisin family serine protease n=1 Tax=Saccharothrix violaceirubra TaxID=413306 RepID=A0A7W7T611_9PSEU|nr:S8 family peptidase [Saccharothrix violaceirubra]MBB4966971.1 subtilisin family serine protease [Saccharothrix violaceirubra]